MGKQLNTTTAVIVVVIVVLVVAVIGWKFMAGKGGTAVDPEADEAAAKSMSPNMSDPALAPGTEKDPGGSPPGGD
ncbi:MAG TPA: hypothetical protein QGH10_25930 [Armatimonadota bacterium]|nr:hypothetical protein [Armatimonadota bacterium]